MNICDNLGDHLVGNVYIKVNLLIQTYTMCSSKVFTMHRLLLHF